MPNGCHLRFNRGWESRRLSHLAAKGAFPESEFERVRSNRALSNTSRHKLRARTNKVDETEVIVAEQEAVGTDTKDAAGSAMDSWPSVRIGEKSSDQVARRAIG